MGLKTNPIDNVNESLWQSRFDDSEKVAADALKTLKKAEKAGYARGIAYSNLNIAAGNFLQSKNDTALKYLTEAFGWFENNRNEKGYVRALLLKGNIFESFGDYEKTLSFWLDAYKVSIEINDTESEGESCSQLGLIYSRLCNFGKALEFFDKGLKIREELGDENAAASSLNRIGMVLRQTKRYDEALAHYFKSLEIRKRNGQISAIPWTLLGIANTYEDLKKYPESLEYYEQGMTGGDKRCTLQCMMGAGRVYSRTGNARLAERRLKESLLMAQELNSMVLVAEAYAALSYHYESSKKPERALKSFKQYLKAKESFQSSEVQSRLSNIEVAHAIEKSEQEKEIYRLRHVELKHAYDLIEEKNRDITASINYASRIQHAILPDPHEIRGLTSDSFILYLPKDIVSGDFYWFTNINKKLIIAVGDCTGHGVPGALMSMLGISFLEEIINYRGITYPGKILDELRKEVQHALHQKGAREEAKDGMDISLCVIDRQAGNISFSGAYNNLYLISDDELHEIPADHMPIGIYDLSDTGFSTRVVHFKPGDLIYMFSDGFADQFGGPGIKKFKYSSFRQVIQEIQSLPVRKQKQVLESRFIEWKGENPQTDDVTVMGMRL
ncbi:MAG: tetratricopeptide repeat protein [Bacteroidales bacterium]|jgi:serine phosphatase RsbU (regulator of sigma subunit)